MYPATANSPIDAAFAPSEADLDPSAALARDRALIKRWSRGDREAGEELLRNYRDFFRRCCVRLGVGDDDQILECFQDVVFGLVSDLEDLAERVASSFGGFLAWRLRDVVSRKRRTRVSAAELPGDLAENRIGPDERAALREAIKRCAEKLPPIERRVFDLRFVAGFDTSETTTALGGAANAVSQSLFRASRKLRECLKAAGFGRNDS